MEIHELQQLLSEMSLQEKIGQMVQVAGDIFLSDKTFDFRKKECILLLSRIKKCQIMFAIQFHAYVFNWIECQ